MSHTTLHRCVRSFRDDLLTSRVSTLWIGIPSEHSGKKVRGGEVGAWITISKIACPGRLHFGVDARDSLLRWVRTSRPWIGVWCSTRPFPPFPLHESPCSTCRIRSDSGSKCGSPVSDGLALIRAKGHKSLDISAYGCVRTYRIIGRSFTSSALAPFPQIASLYTR